MSDPEGTPNVQIMDEDLRAAARDLVNGIDLSNGGLWAGVHAAGVPEASCAAVAVEVALDRDLGPLRAQAGDVAVGRAAGRELLERADG